MMTAIILKPYQIHKISAMLLKICIVYAIEVGMSH